MKYINSRIIKVQIHMNKIYCHENDGSFCINVTHCRNLKGYTKIEFIGLYVCVCMCECVYVCVCLFVIKCCTKNFCIFMTRTQSDLSTLHNMSTKKNWFTSENKRISSRRFVSMVWLGRKKECYFKFQGRTDNYRYYLNPCIKLKFLASE